MAVNSRVPWCSSLSLNLRDSEYAEQGQAELFQNLEKLIASAVAICRLDGSLQCQIGGLITVIEELQRLLRHSFTEIKRLEKTLEYQKQNFSTTISDLNKQINDIKLNGSKCSISDDVMLSIPMSPRDTPSSNGSSQLVRDIKAMENDVHVSLVDESYGNEDESDTSIPINVNGQPDIPDSDVVESVVNESANTDPTVKEDDNTNVLLDKEVSVGVKTTESILVEKTSKSVLLSEKTTQTSGTPIEINKGDKTELVPRMLKRLKMEADSLLPKRQGRSQSLSPRISVKLHNSQGKTTPAYSTGKSKLARSRGLKGSNRSQQIRRGKASPKTAVQLSQKSTGSVKTDFPHTKGFLKSKATENNAIFQGRKRKSDPGMQALKSTAPSAAMDRNINLDFLLMVNQVMSELVSDHKKEEAALNQVKTSERSDLMKLAKLYRLRVRMMGKIEDDFPVVLVKGRESCLPKPGEVDVLLSSLSDAFVNKKQATLAKETSNKHKYSQGKTLETKSKKRKT